ncbi:MAG: hypothetical protein HY401_01100 [Elusimicrobia bacterium]|nr:hypothetical protein [Elusimicrobiota bacterium]
MSNTLDGRLAVDRHPLGLAFLLGHHLEEALALSITSVFKRDQVIFYENHWPQGLYFVDPEKVSFLSDGPGSGASQDKINLGGFVVLGLEALVKGEPYRLRAVAADDTNIYFVPKTVFFSWIDRLTGVGSQAS